MHSSMAFVLLHSNYYLKKTNIPLVFFSKFREESRKAFFCFGKKTNIRNMKSLQACDLSKTDSTRLKLVEPLSRVNLQDHSI